jgi:hypothetical protein
MAKKKTSAAPVDGKPQPFCTLSLKVGGNEFTASGPEEFVIDQRDWFMEESNVGHQAGTPGSGEDAG